VGSKRGGEKGEHILPEGSGILRECWRGELPPPKKTVIWRLLLDVARPITASGKEIVVRDHNKKRPESSKIIFQSLQTISEYKDGKWGQGLQLKGPIRKKSGTERTKRSVRETPVNHASG